MIHAYVINLDSATDRLARIGFLLDRERLPWQRISAIHGSTLKLPMAEFSEDRFRRLHGRQINIFEIGCYLSHLKAMRAFLQTDQEMALICEDDVVPEAEFSAALARILATKQSWNILRLSGLSKGGAVRLAPVENNYFLCVNMQRLKGAGAYLVDRKAASAFVARLLPMWLPWDHAMDREWFFGLRAMCIYPFPISQTKREFRTSIQSNSQPKHSPIRRQLTVYPYQAGNEIARFFCRWMSWLSWKSQNLAHGADRG